MLSVYKNILLLTYHTTSTDIMNYLVAVFVVCFVLAQGELLSNPYNRYSALKSDV